MTRPWLTLVAFFGLISPASATDWLHWRGPLQTGYSTEKNLPDEWDPRVPGKDNLVWKAPYFCRSTPLVMAGKVYVSGPDKEPLGVPTLEEKRLIGEKVTCVDAKTGKLVWEQTFNVFHSDIVVTRLGWSPIAGDPAGKRIFAHTTGGTVYCFDAETGKILWTRQMTEEFGRFTGYGGRIGGGPIFDSGLVIIGLVQGSWGNFAPNANRFLALDGATGNIVWWSEAIVGPARGTYYSNPVVAIIKGQRQLISGGADGAVHGFQVRTGKKLWSYVCATGNINGSPVVDGNLVYCNHGEENPEGAAAGLGRVVCLDASQVEGGKPKLVWEYRKGIRFGLASAAFADGKLYVPDDSAKLYCFNGKTGKMLWKYSYGTVSRGAPLIADGKVYISESNAKFHIIKLKEDGSEPDESETHTVNFRIKPGGAGFVESHCTPAVADGVVYFGNHDDLFAISTGKQEAKTGTSPEVKPKSLPLEKEGETEVGQLALYPADITLKAGESFEFQVKTFTASGQPIKAELSNLEWSLPEPPLPKGAKTAPPALRGLIVKGKVSVDAKVPAQQGYVEVKSGTLTARARVRVAPQIPYSQNFEMVPLGAVPSGWVNTQGKFSVVEKDGTKVLSKVNNNPLPPIARANAYITLPSASNYTIESDAMATEKRDKLPDFGLVNSRYTMILDGKVNDKGKHEVRIVSWEALPTPLPAGRVSAVAEFDWKPGTWYRMKFSVEPGEKEAICKGKVWARGTPEPAEWTVTLKDPRPNTEGAAALYGYVSNAVSDMEPGCEIYFDNVTIKPNK
jgi:outer membrane protein assembly factor BamB